MARMAYFDAIGHDPAAAPAPFAQVSQLSSYLDADADPGAAVSASDATDPVVLVVEYPDGLDNDGMQGASAPDLDPGPDLPDAVVQDPNDDTSRDG
ncbi:hypothetical protein JM93_04042 [Roseibium hamelinense]|uniref:Uncharacterized protein n=1 Tax=Roseibium hamelinense TaxID=150831 RepID=A0A562SHM9_9HYPH|nr:hypothetical protein [Roseibium hamelinense]MTI43878.1 hypothetical protein [Roseibium hamelinense]TWI80827.1 hypothetical protein JM93_04042 [Roseibium hamelinense]